ncbi:MAG: site-2 protease family protein, partial [Candidatus Marinimicrobia bacterium]|nr:site-2 protease family protein [Candidatus Neomarinimicrobiota bacterium]
LVWQRDDAQMKAEVRIGINPNPVQNDSTGMLGIAPVWEYQPVNFVGAIKAGAMTTVNGFTLIYLSLKMIVGDASLFKEIGGPIAIAQYAGEAAEMGWVYLVRFMALISVNLAFINILPIPGLDGGHILVIIIEALRRKPLTIKTRMVIQQIGMALLLVLIFFIMGNDIWKLIFNN